MPEASQCKHFVRKMYPWEIHEAQRVFGNSLDYAKIRIHECFSLTNALHRFGQWLRRQNSQPEPNAITLGNHCFFPIRLPEAKLEPGDPEHYQISWLIHELTHAWQFQHMGWKYLYQALRIQWKEKGKAYDFGQEEGLKRRQREGWKLAQFNLEQQGDICRGYYDRLCRGQDTQSWQPYIQQVQEKALRRRT